MSPKIAIVGGGIGGLMLAIGLHQRGISVDIYERAPKASEISAGIAFGPNSVEAIAMLSSEVLQLMKSASTHNTQRTLNHEDSTWINFRSGMESGELITSVQTLDHRRTGLNSVSRAVFHVGLCKLLPEQNLHFDKCLVDIVTLPNHRVRLHFADGAATEVDAVVGADGVRSRVRKTISQRQIMEEDLRFSGTVAYRSVLPMRIFESILGFELAHNAQMYLGKNGHILTYPINKHNDINIVAFMQSEHWNHKTWVIKDVSPDDLTRHFQGWALPVQKVLRAMLTTSVDLWAIYETVELRKFAMGPVVIMGDAAHASTPHQGAGAGQAIEDALVLAELISEGFNCIDHDQNFTSHQILTDIFSAYDCIRRPRSQKVVRTSWEAGKLYASNHHFEDQSRSIRRDLETRLGWIWHEDMALQVARALTVFDQLRAVRLVGAHNVGLVN